MHKKNSPGQPGRRFSLFENTETQDSVAEAQIAEVINLPKFSSRPRRGLPQTTYSVDIRTEDGSLYRNTPILSPYVNGPYGDHVAYSPGTVGVVLLLGVEPKQPYFIGCFTPRGGDGSFAGTPADTLLQGVVGRPPLAPGDRMWSSPGQLGMKGNAFMYFARTGFTVFHATNFCERVYDPSLERIQDYTRNYRLLTGFGSTLWTEKPLSGREGLFRRTVFQRAKKSLRGPGAYVDTQEGAVRDVDAGGQVASPTKRLISCKDYNGNLKVDVDENGNLRVFSAGSIDIDTTKAGDTAASLTGTTTTLSSAINGEVLTLAINGTTFTMNVFTTSKQLAAVAQEIGENYSEIITGIDGTTGGVTLTTKKTGISASLTASGAAATSLGFSTAPITGTEGNGTQDFDMKHKGGVTMSLGSPVGTTRRSVELTITKAGNVTLDILDKAKLTFTKNVSNDVDVKLEMKKGKLDLDCDSFNLKASDESTLEVPSLKIGNTDFGDTLVAVNKFLQIATTRDSAHLGHTHIASAFGSPTTGSSTPLPAYSKTGIEQSDIKVDS